MEGKRLHFAYSIDISKNRAEEYGVGLHTQDIAGLIRIWDALPQNLARKLHGGIAVGWADASITLNGLSEKDAKEFHSIAADTLRLDLSQTFRQPKSGQLFKADAQGVGGYEKAASDLDTDHLLKDNDVWGSFHLFIHHQGYIICYKNTESVDSRLELYAFDLPAEDGVNHDGHTLHVLKGRLYARDDAHRSETRPEAVGDMHIVTPRKFYVIKQLLLSSLNLPSENIDDIAKAIKHLCETSASESRYVVETGEKDEKGERRFFTVGVGRDDKSRLLCEGTPRSSIVTKECGLGAHAQPINSITNTL